MIAVRLVGAAPSFWKLATAIGNWLEPTPEISTFNWAWAVPIVSTMASAMVIQASTAERPVRRLARVARVRWRASAAR